MKPLTVKEFTQDEPPKLAILFTERTDGPTDQPTGWERYWVFTATVVSVDPEDGTPRNLTSSRQPLADFGVRAQTDSRREQPGSYGWEINCDHPGTLYARDAERIVTTFRTLTRRMEKISARSGNPDSLSAFVLQFAEACGIERFVTFAPGSERGWYSKGTYEWFNAKDAADYIRSRERAAFDVFHPAEVR